MSTETVWAVIESDIHEDQSLALIAATADAAKRATEDYVTPPGAERHRLAWKRLNSMFDGQDVWHAAHGTDDYYIHEEVVQR